MPIIFDTLANISIIFSKCSRTLALTRIHLTIRIHPLGGLVNTLMKDSLFTLLYDEFTCIYSIGYHTIPLYHLLYGSFELINITVEATRYDVSCNVSF